jgi:zinc protease
MVRRLIVLGFVILAACGGSTAPAPAHPAPGPASGGNDEAMPPGGTPAAAMPNPDTVAFPLWPEVTKGTLPNGLTYYILKHGKPEKRALLWLAVNAGSVQEDDDQRGLAHFDEHMAFNGTQRFPKADIVNYLEKIGMRFGADLNAYTSWEETVYQLEVPTDEPSYLAKGLDILRDWAGGVTYDPEEVKKESGVVLEEWRLGRGAGMRLFDKHAKVQFAGSRYADRITIGLPEIIKAANRDALTRFYKDWYRPDLMAVIAVGDVDPKAIEKQIQDRFGDLKRPDKPRARPPGGVPSATGTRVSIETDKEASSTTVSITNQVGHRPEATRRDLRRLIAERLYAQILNERLATLGRKSDAPFIRAAAGISSVTRDIDGFSRSAQVKGGKVEDSLRTLATEVLRIERHGITAPELERARTNTKRALEQLAETEATRDSRDFTSEITRNFFEHEFMIGSTAEKQLTLELLPQITVDEMNGLAKAFEGSANRVVVISGPDGQPLPAKDKVLAILDEVAKSQITPWEDKPTPKSLMAQPPTPGKIVKETKVASVDVTEWTLSNGVRVIVKPTDFEIDAVSIAGSSPGGEATIKDKDYNDARFADSVASIGGAGEYDAETLGKILTGKQVRVSTSIGEVTESVSAGGSAHDLETMMQLIHLKLSAPRKDEQQFGVWKTNFIEQITNMKRSPEVQFGRESSAAEYANQLRRRPVEAADIEKVNLDNALAFYKARFGDASDFTFVIVGAVKLDELRPLVETYLASLPATKRKEKEIDLKIRKVGGIVQKTWNLGTEPKASVRIDFHGDLPWTRDTERDMSILGSAVSIRLREVMREDMGGVYGVGAGGGISRSPYQERSFTLRFGCDPARVDELVKAAFDVFDEAAAKGASDMVLEKLKSTFLRERETALKTNRFWVGWLTSAYRYGDDPALVLDTEAVTKRMTADNIKKSAKRFLDRKAYFRAVLVPAAAAAAPAAGSSASPAKP